MPSPLPPSLFSLHPNLPVLCLSALQTLLGGWLGAAPKRLFGKWSYLLNLSSFGLMHLLESVI